MKFYHHVEFYAYNADESVWQSELVTAWSPDQFKIRQNFQNFNREDLQMKPVSFYWKHCHESILRGLAVDIGDQRLARPS